MKNVNNQMFMPYGNTFYPNMPGELENRISSLERIVNKLDSRLNKLESINGIYANNTIYQSSIPNTYDNYNGMHIM
jgi:hypothetical protein